MLSYKQPFLALAWVLSSSIALTAPALTQAATYGTVVDDESHITFQYQQMGVKMDGRFTAFRGELSFDPEHPEAGQAAFEVDLNSVDTGTADGNDEVVGKDWFHVAEHPVASFVSHDIQVTGDDQYEVSGTLTIKGVEQEVVVPAQFHETDGKGIFEAAFTLQRGDYAIGEGSWSAFDIVANDVTVTIELVTAPN